MNHLTRAFIVLLFFPVNSQCIDLQTAILNKQVTAQFLSTGSHRNKCLRLVIENNDTKPTEIKILPGTYLQNNDSTRQDIILVENEYFVLQGNEKRELIFKGFCCKRRRGSPHKNDQFIVRSAIDIQMAGLCDLLLRLKEFEYAGQEAIWSLVGNSDPNKIVGADSTKTMQLRKFVGNALGKKIKPFIWTSYNRPAIITHNELKIRSQGNHYMREVKTNDVIEYAIYDEADSAITQIIKERVVANKWNKHNCIWKFEVENLNPSKKFYLRIKVNGTIQKEWLYHFWS